MDKLPQPERVDFVKIERVRNGFMIGGSDVYDRQSAVTASIPYVATNVAKACEVVELLLLGQPFHNVEYSQQAPENED